jgi:hypothetical protein
MTETLAPEPTQSRRTSGAGAAHDADCGPTTALAVAAVLIAVGYRLFRTEGSAAVTDITVMLPKGARIVSTGVAGDRLLVTLDVGGVTEIRTFDAHTLKPAGRLKFVSEP